MKIHLIIKLNSFNLQHLNFITYIRVRKGDEELKKTVNKEKGIALKYDALREK